MDHLRAGMHAAQQEVMQVEGVLDSMRSELVGLLRNRLVLKKPFEEGQEASSAMESHQELESQISDIRELISDTEDVYKELSRVFEVKKNAYERALEQERLERIRESQIRAKELQDHSERVTTTGGVIGAITQKSIPRPKNQKPRYHPFSWRNLPMVFLN